MPQEFEDATGHFLEASRITRDNERATIGPVGGEDSETLIEDFLPPPPKHAFRREPTRPTEEEEDPWEEEEASEMVDFSFMKSRVIEGPKGTCIEVEHPAFVTEAEEASWKGAFHHFLDDVYTVSGTGFKVFKEDDRRIHLYLTSKKRRVKTSSSRRARTRKREQTRKSIRSSSTSKSPTHVCTALSDLSLDQPGPSNRVAHEPVKEESPEGQPELPAEGIWAQAQMIVQFPSLVKGDRPYVTSLGRYFDNQEDFVAKGGNLDWELEKAICFGMYKKKEYESMYVLYDLSKGTIIE